MRILPALAASALIATLALGASAGPTGTSKGGVTGAGSAGTSEDKPHQKWDESLVAKSKKVKPGKKHTNGDGVTVENNSDKASETVRMTPAKGDKDSATSVQSKKGVDAEISGIDDNDMINLGPQNNVTVSGTAGGVSIASNSIVTVTNTGTDPSGPSIRVTQLNGTQAFVGPGLTRVFNNTGN